MIAVIFELKAEYGFASEDAEIHLWHLVREGSSLALCDRSMPAGSRTRSAVALRDVFPERLCQDCRRRYCELLPSLPPTASATSATNVAASATASATAGASAASAPTLAAAEPRASVTALTPTAQVVRGVG